MGHIMLHVTGTLSEPRAGAYFQRLRSAFNVTRKPSAQPFPPLEEWQGISAYCNNLPCRCGLYSYVDWDVSARIY